MRLTSPPPSWPSSKLRLAFSRHYDGVRWSWKRSFRGSLHADLPQSCVLHIAVVESSIQLLYNLTRCPLRHRSSSNAYNVHLILVCLINVTPTPVVQSNQTPCSAPGSCRLCPILHRPHLLEVLYDSHIRIHVAIYAVLHAWLLTAVKAAGGDLACDALAEASAPSVSTSQ